MKPTGFYDDSWNLLLSTEELERFYHKDVTKTFGDLFVEKGITKPSYLYISNTLNVDCAFFNDCKLISDVYYNSRKGDTFYDKPWELRFKDCDIKTIHLCKSVDFPMFLLRNNPNAHIFLSKDSNLSFDETGNQILSNDNKTLYFVKDKKECTNLVLSDKITKIADFCFAFTENIESVTGSGVKEILGYAFFDSHIKKLYFSECESILGDGVFSSYYIQEIILPNLTNFDPPSMPFNESSIYLKSDAPKGLSMFFTFLKHYKATVYCSEIVNVKRPGYGDYIKLLTLDKLLESKTIQQSNEILKSFYEEER